MSFLQGVAQSFPYKVFSISKRCIILMRSSADEDQKHGEPENRPKLMTSKACFVDFPQVYSLTALNQILWESDSRAIVWGDFWDADHLDQIVLICRYRSLL